MPEETILLGKDCKAYIEGSAVGFDNLVEMANVKDLSIPLSAGEADATTRANGGWRNTVATLRELSVNFQMRWKDSDTNFQKIRDAYLNSDPIEAAFLTGAVATTGSEGPYGTFAVTGFTRNENLEEAVMVDVSMKLSTWYGWVEDGVDPVTPTPTPTPTS